MKLYVISDITFDHIAKEIDLISNGNISRVYSFEEDVVAKMLSLTPGDLKDFDLVFIHSDQVFHRRPIEWQKMFCKALVQFSVKFKDMPLLVSNSFSNSFTYSPAKYSFGKLFDTAFQFSNEFQKLIERPNIFVFDFLAILQNIGENSFYNYNIGHLYQMPYTPKAIKQLAVTLQEQANWLFREEKKVIIVDCDNTLWKGVIGEDGMNGIYCDKDAEGIIHYHFQEFLKNKKEEGFLLCICSKNNEDDVKEAFEKKNFVLKWTDFIVRKINWNDKVANMKEIAAELNIGTNSFIFIDDNKFELDYVHSLLSGVTCIEFTEEYTDFLHLTERFEFKKRLRLTDDKIKTEQYMVHQQRAAEEQQFENLDDFITSLNIKMDIRLNDITDFERLSQLTGKTNQFNFNKQPYTTEQLNSIIDKGGRIYSLKVSDKFGDYGTVGLIILTPENDKKFILENFLMSCRALGKKIEDSFYAYVLEDLKKNGLQITSISFKETEKNIPAQKFYSTLKK